MDLTTTYLGLTLRSPLIASASPLNREIHNLRQLQNCGAAAVVLPSLFEEQIEVGSDWLYAGWGGDSYAEAVSSFPPADSYRIDPKHYLELIQRARDALEIPVIASLNGIFPGEWTKYAYLAEQAGASAIELNTFLVPASATLSGDDIERRYVQILRAVKAAVSIPVAMKLSAWFSAPAHTVRVLEMAGADGFVLFNRFYEPDIDLAAMTVRHGFQLSPPGEIQLPFRWIAMLSGQVRGSLAASTGVDNSNDVVKYILAGADVVMTTSALLRHGIQHMRTLVSGLQSWLQVRQCKSVADVRGKMSEQIVNSLVAYGRATYIKTLHA